MRALPKPPAGGEMIVNTDRNKIAGYHFRGRFAIFFVIGSLVAALGILFSPATSAANELDLILEPVPTVQDVDGEQVRQSIQRGVRFLLREQGAEGYWREYSSQPGAQPALVLLALLNCDVDPNSPELRDALRKTSQQKPSMTYASSLIIMALAQADPIRFRPQIRQHAEYLVSIQTPLGGWGYSAGTWQDSSNAQFAILALHEAQLAGVPIDKEVWRRARSYWESSHDRAGGGSFGYMPGRPTATGSMTCAGICSLVFIDENLEQAAATVRGDNVNCCQTAKPNPMIEAGLSWLGKHFSVTRNPSQRGGGDHGSALYYYMYSLERTGRITGRRFIGKHDWYREGTRELLTKQELDGSWKNPQDRSEGEPLIATSMALLFLSKGLRPILIAKYKHGDDASWDPHPQGIHLLTRFVEEAWTRKLNWQTIEATVANPNDLLETPVLHITGDRRLKLSFEQIANLKKYLDSGGFLFIEAQNGFGCPSAKLFDQDVRELLSVLIPDSKLEVLKPDHAVWTSHFQVQPDQDFALLGIQSCCRTSVIYSAGPLTGFWQLKKPNMVDYSDTVQKKINYSVQLGTNILAFATGNELKDKLDRPKMDADDRQVRELVGRRILVPKLRHRSGFDDAPLALANLLRRVSQDRGVQFSSQVEFADADLESLLDYPIVFVHGRGRFSLNQGERDALRLHLERGGFVFGDAICGDKAFADSFREEMLTVLPSSQWESLTREDWLLSERYGGYKIGQVQMRLPGLEAGQPPRTMTTDVKLEGLQVGQRYRVIFSPYDISCALESGTSSSCYGYSTDDAARLGANILLYALQP